MAEDPFEGSKAVKGYEKFGRVIVDANGQVSGSPANFENLRGSDWPFGMPRPVAIDSPTNEDALAAMAAEYAPSENVV